MLYCLSCAGREHVDTGSHRPVTVYTVKCWLNCFLRWERKTLRQQYRRCMIDTTTIQFTTSGHHRKEEVGAGQDPQGTEIPAPFWKVDLNSKHSERLHKKGGALGKKKRPETTCCCRCSTPHCEQLKKKTLALSKKMLRGQTAFKLFFV